VTTIAWDGRIVAADTLGINGHVTQGPVRKVRESECKRFVYCITGFSAWFDAWIRWFETPALSGVTPAPECAPKWTGGDRDQGNFIVFDRQDGRCWQFGCDLPYPQECVAPAAWGSGESYAMGAMKAGADAERAVGVAMECDVFSGGDIVVMNLMAPQLLTDAA
jgi:hypothetical protein